MSNGFAITEYELIEVPTDIPKDIPFVMDDCSLAFHLGFRNKVMWYMLNDIPAQYKVHKIPKKKGGVRIIHDPSDILKLMQSQFLIKFLVPLQNKLGDHVTAYREGRSMVDAVKRHIPECPICDAAPKGNTPLKHDCTRKGTFIQMDLKDFFPRTSAAMVRNYCKSLGYSHYVSSLMASLLTVRDIENPQYDRMKALKVPYMPKYFAGVPQGAPTSGAICNLVANQELDYHLLRYLKQLGTRYGTEFVYSRYSDDLTFSCAVKISRHDERVVIQEINNIVAMAGYKVNTAKTRSTPGHYRRTLLGTVCNDKPNYAKDSYYRYRAITHNCLLHGFASQVERAKQKNVMALVSWLRGNINWINQINPAKGAKLKAEFDMAMVRHEGEVTHAAIG